MASMDFFTDRIWRMRAINSSKRRIIDSRDLLEFIPLPRNRAKLIVRDANTEQPTLPSEIKLRLVRGELIGEDYGRELTFRQKGAGLVIEYAADFLLGTGQQPDEGGDGDPK
jgi:hypothetical protein